MKSNIKLSYEEIMKIVNLLDDEEFQLLKEIVDEKAEEQEKEETKTKVRSLWDSY